MFYLEKTLRHSIGASQITRRTLILMRRAGKPFQHLGSAVMRGDQLAALVAPHLPDDLHIRVLSFHAGLAPPLAMRIFARTLPVGSVVVFVKSAAKGLTRAHIAGLRRRDVRIGLDCIDTPLDEIDFELFDFHIAASFAGQTALEERLRLIGKGGVPVELLHHHYDPRLREAGGPNNRPFRCGYVGEPQNAFIPHAIEDAVDRIDVSYSRDFARSLTRITELTLHYGVRPPPARGASIARVYKPFTKGFTAAACASNILVNRETDDAVALLGKDYPFLVSASDPKSVVDGFECARDSYGGPVWREGLDRLRALKELVAPPALAARLRDIVEAVSA